MTNPFTGPYSLLLKYGLVVAFLGSFYAYAQHRQFKADQADFATAKLEAVQRAITQAQEIAKQDAEIVSSNVQTVQGIRERTETIRKKEQKHATANPLPAECVLDDERVRNINAALSNKDADSGKPDYTLPATPKIGK